MKRKKRLARSNGLTVIYWSDMLGISDIVGISVSCLDSPAPRWEKECESYWEAGNPACEIPSLDRRFRFYAEDFDMNEPVRFVGAGPGDPELITVKGMRLLREADRVVYAGSLVPKTLLQYCREGVKTFDSASLTLARTHELLKEGYEAGERVVRLHTGDPCLYGALNEQMVLLDRDDIAYEVIPGVSAGFAAAAALKKELTIPELSQTVILTRLGGRTPVPEKEDLAALASHRASMVIYLSVQKIEEVVAKLCVHYPGKTPAMVAYRVGWPDQLLLRSTLDSIAALAREEKIGRQALILVGEVFGGKSLSGEELKRSKLYDESFSHQFRDAE